MIQSLFVVPGHNLDLSHIDITVLDDGASVADTGGGNAFQVLVGGGSAVELNSAGGHHCSGIRNWTRELGRECAYQLPGCLAAAVV